jgi:hypothetical protein
LPFWQFAGKGDGERGLGGRAWRRGSAIALRLDPLPPNSCTRIATFVPAANRRRLAAIGG